VSELQRAGRTDEFADGSDSNFALIFVFVFAQEVSASLHQSFRRVFLHKSPWNVRARKKDQISRELVWVLAGKFAIGAPFSFAVLLSDLVSAALEPNLKPSLISLRLQCSVHFFSNLSTHKYPSTSFSVYRSLSL
jgi:hypothetical protein